MHRVVRIAPWVAAVVVLLAGCGAQLEGTAPGSRGRLQVVAAENFWGSIAAQLGGERVQVRSIIADPAVDPHSYEPSAQDARTLAGARLVLVNGIGYDGWASRLLAANPVSGRVTLDIGDLLGLHAGSNPHQWYSPPAVHRVIAQIATDYSRLDPGAADYYARRRTSFETRGLARYEQLLRAIRARYAGVSVGYSESIFQPLGESLGLRLLTPYGFARAIAQGSEVTAQDKRTVDEQVTRHQVAVWVFNRQNVTPDVERVNALARAARIPIATVTETLSPPSYSFQRWQVAELEGLVRALHLATGR